jgi:hypothetical protein
MNLFPFKKARAIIVRAPRPAPADRPHAVWTRDPRTGRLIQTWTSGDDSERSCTRRLRPPLPYASDGLRRAA